MSLPRPYLALPRALALAGLIAAAPLASLHAQEHAHPAGGAERLGRVALPTSCAPAAAPELERAVAMLHSFWFAEAASAFQAVAAADPGCAMAAWGTAMTLMNNPMTRVAPPAEAMRDGLAAARRARDLALRQSHREQMYAEAVIAFYDGEGRDHAARMRAHEEALAALHRAHPEDREAAIFYARAVVANAPPADLTFARQLAGAAILQPLFAETPDHPGLAHYLIHAFDAPALADRGTEAALAYAGIAPSAPHALHMPSHIFTRLGHWDRSIETNARSAAAEATPAGAVHPLDYMVYAYLQLGRDTAAAGVVRRAMSAGDGGNRTITAYNFAAMPARYALERSAWAEAARLAVPSTAAPYVEAVTRFARAIGAARSRAADGGRAEIDALARLEQSLRGQNDAYWATIVGAQRLAAEAWAAHGSGDPAAAIRLAAEAATLEETVEKHPVTPGPLLPARELEGDLLMELGRPSEALRAYESTLAREPNRARALHGAARAAAAAGNRSRARVHYAALLELMAGADLARGEPAEARAFLAGP